MDSVGNPNSSNTEDDIQTNGWTQISTGFQNTNNWSSIYPIPFTFKFFNDTVTNFKVSYNGLLTFDTNAVKLPNLNINLPDTSLPNQTIMCFWDEFTDDPPTGSNDVSWIKTFGTSPNRQFWIKWFSFEYGNPNTSYSFFAIVLEETTNKIYLIDMQLAASSVSSTIGLQLNDSTAVQFGSNNIDFGSGSQILEDNDYYEFIPFINVSPQASFKISDTLSCTGIISFTDLSLYSPTSWHWDFGDGDTSINQNPVHIYATSDTFTVILTATNGNGTDTIIKSDLIIVDISSPPSAPACTPTTSNYCCGYGINNVILNTINHSSGDGKDGYQDYSCYVNTNVYAGGLYNLSVLIDSPLLHNVRAWIDFNNDNSFNDVTELVFDYQDVYDASGSIYISTSAIRDTFLRLRISAETNLLPAPNSCTNLTSGQVEDYGIKILDNPNPPSVNFIVDDTLTCDGVVNFTDSTLNDPKTWFWDFGDSNTDTVQNPSHVYASSGYYNVKLVVTNSNGSDSITKNSFIKVTIGNDPITPSCMPSTQSYCCGYGITNLLFDSINNTSLDAAEGYQDFSCAYQTTIQEGKQYPISITTGSSAHDTRVWIDFDNDGVFIDSTEMVFEALNAASPSGTIYIPSVQNKLIPLRLRISTDNAGGNISSCTNPFRGQVEDYTVFVDSNPDPPQPNFIASDSTSCDGIISFNDFSLNLPDSWYWDFGDFTFDTIQNPLHTYNQPGIYTVKLIVSNKNGIDSLVKTNYINVLTTAGGPVSPMCTVSTWSYCCGFGINRVLFNSIDTATNDGIDGYQDYSCFQKTTVFQGQSYPVSIYTNPSFYESVRVWIDYNNDGDFNISNELAFQSIGDTLHDGSILIPFTSVTDTLLRMRVVSDSWTNPLPFYCDSVQFGQAEDYGIIILKPPIANFSIELIDTCNEAIQVIDSSQNANSIYWDFNDGYLDSISTVIHTYDSSYLDSFYVVELIACYDSICDTSSKMIKRKAAYATFSFTPDTVYIPYSTTISFQDSSRFDITSWDWKFGDGDSSNMQNPSHQYLNPNAYLVSLTVANSTCINQISKQIIALETGIEELTNSGRLIIYPNPANEKFSIILPISGEDLTIEITDVLGKIVYIEHLLSNGEIEKHINMGSSKGFYFIKVYNSKYNFIGRIMLN